MTIGCVASKALALVVLVGIPPAIAQVTTGNVTGSVRDAQGAAVPGASVTLVSATRGTAMDVRSNENGDFLFPNVTPDTYTIRVALDGFKTLERPDITVSPGDRKSAGTLTLEVGGMVETVTVATEAPLLQANSGERSFTVSNQAVEHLPINTRNWAALTALTPGVVGTTRLGNPGSQNNTYMLDGVAIMDTGNNGQMLQTNVDAIDEVKILTSGYQAEYGRSSGMQITAVTKSGSNRYRGSVYDLERNSDWNENAWVNQKNGDPSPVSKERDWGYTLGGPIGRPGGVNKLFFFYAHEYRPRTSGGAVRQFRVPTLLERQGDFSQSTDRNGALVPIRDHRTGQPFPGGRIPRDRLYPIGLNILKLWPEPNVQELSYNYENTAPEDTRLTQQPTVRVDYQVSSRLRLTARYTGQLGTVKAMAGTIPGFNDTLQTYPFIYNPAASVNYAVSPTLFLEGTYGFIQNQLGFPSINQASNRCNVGLCELPLLFPEAGVADARYYSPTVLEDIDSPMFVDGRILLPPLFTWGNRIANPPPNLPPPFINLNRTHNVNVTVTRVAGRHAFKAGVYWYTAYKAETGLAGGAIPFTGALNFGNDANNPLDTGFGFANAALGVFSEYSQQSKFNEGAYRYRNVEWFVQDNWKLSHRTTVDYGLRFTHQQPQYDSLLQASNFFPEQWSLSKAPLLYVPGCSVAARPCPSASRVAVNPATGGSLGAASAVAIGTLVPNSGDVTNGVTRAGEGIARENYTWPAVVVAPRLGIAHDVTGTQRFVLRGNVGLFYDRPEGGVTANQINNPPNSTATTVRHAQLQTLDTDGLKTRAPAQMVIFEYDAKIPSTWQWSGGIQIALPWAAAAEVSYVASHGQNLVTPIHLPVDINAPGFGAAFLPGNQDPTLSNPTPGGAALTTDLLRPFRGYGAINMQWPRFWNDFHSIQASFNRRFQKGLQLGFNYTLTLRQEGTNDLTPASGLRFVHNADGSFTEAPDWDEAEALLADNGLRRHFFKASFVWDPPDVRDTSTAMRTLGLIANDWQLSGIWTGGSGARYDIGYSYQRDGANVNLTGSPSYAARVRIVGDPGDGCSGNQYAQFNTAAFAGPLTGSNGLESGRNYMVGCFENALDLAVARTIRIHRSKDLQFRLDVFNAFNSLVYTSRMTQLQLNSPTEQTVLNAQYNADGTLNQARLQPRNAGFGAATGAAALRSLQLQLRFQF